ncbi:hypothetical protein [Algiphilus aromaticivorans]|jgi:hypothetical protein|uniref:hypothetical protein n=1 Tax=Algiphilus aromaticivorans TaxID=382454 RepID=UPI0005C1F161|nr:hypothetical protein [Algiphilus aromaticivorans]
MAAKKKPRPETDFDDSEDAFDDSDSVDWKDDDSESVDENGKQRSAAPPGVRLRDWRDVERFREDRALRRLLAEDDLLFDDD